ncbi:hypothetical protein [Alteromonas sp. CYL-A6]|uniref:hypothetical protein n=1 Tax=Alteromonas nitratireducens TaxID=3390813 RepID=UPI0034A779E6
MKKQTWLHIGPPKTGTSAIQRWLVSNRDLLTEHGIFYPEHELGPNGISSGHLHCLLSQTDAGWEVDETKVSRLLKAFEDSGCNRLLLSSEYFFYHIDTLVRLLPGVRVVAYIRCPMETYESAYNQGVKRHGKTEPLSFSKNLHTTTLDTLAAAANTLSGTRFYFRAYLNTDKADFNLLADFADLLNLPVVPDNTSTNPSYSLEALKVKRWLNQFKLAELEADIDGILQGFPDGTRHYTLLPEDKLERHTKQCINALREFHAAFHIKGAKHLIASVKNRQTRQIVSQDISPDAVVMVANYMFDTAPDLYGKICQSLPAPTGTKDDNALLRQFTQHHSPSRWPRLQKFIKRLFAK